MSGNIPKSPSVLMGASVVALTLALAVPGLAFAQESATAAPKNDTGVKDDNVVVVTGYRKSLQTSLNQKRRADVMLDAITADDIASFPEANLAESLQRIPGISIDRDNGEGRQISVRGLGGDFTRVRINGMEALSTGAANDSGSSPNRSRAFDFNAFASELFNNVQVRKTASAETDEGSLGATVDLNTGHPFDYKGKKLALSLEDAYYENGGHQNPRIAGLYSNRWAGGRMGFLISGAYQVRDTSISSYGRSPGQSDYEYRGSSWAGNEYPQRAGFAAPTGTTFPQQVLIANGTCPTSPGNTTPTPTGSQLVGTICTGNAANYAITNADVLAALTGSDPAAYASLFGTGLSTTGRFDDSLVRIPALATLNDQELHSERLGVTSSFQIQLSDDTRLTMDYLHSRFRNESINYQIQSVGLNRNNTNATYNTLTNTATVATKRGLYPSLCTAAAETATTGAVDCGQQLYGAAPVAGYTFSFNPYNLDTYEYYNNPTSVGYVANAFGVAGRAALIGRPATKVLDAHVSNGVADYLKLSNVDWRSAADASFYTTTFDQLSFNLDHRFADTFKMTANIGLSKSLNENQGLLVEFNSMDRPESFIYDERGSPSMPVVNPGFDVANAANWNIVKGFSGMRHYLRTTKNDYSQARVDFQWVKSDRHEIRFGMSAKKYGFSTDQYERITDTLNPTEKEAGVSVASLGSIREFGQGLEVSNGTPTSFFAPDLDKFSSVFGYDCNCVNKYGDFRITNKRNNTAQFGVTERDTGFYAQLNFKYEVLGRDLTGNIGVRQADTKVEATGRTSAGRPLVESNQYSDTLPSLNLNYRVLDNLYVRVGASKAMARPLLGNLSPNVSAISVPSDGSTIGGTLTVGNTQLKPFRSENLDLSVEWYFAKDSLFSFAVFDKKIASFPQTILYDAKLSEFLDADSIAALKLQLSTNPVQLANQIAYIDNGNTFTARQYRDAPGGSLYGWEANFQTDFTMLPGFWKNFGIQVNATHIDSKLTYILDPGAKVGATVTVQPTYGTGPWLNASPDALNLTLYYEVPQFSARVSMAQRAGYYTTFPLAAGSCSPGLQNPTNTTTPAAASATRVACDGPLVNDFGGSKATQNIDAVLNWNFSDHLSARLEGLNLTNQTSNRYAYTGNPVVTSYASSGRQITLGLRYRY